MTGWNAGTESANRAAQRWRVFQAHHPEQGEFPHSDRVSPEPGAAVSAACNEPAPFGRVIGRLAPVAERPEPDEVRAPLEERRLGNEWLTRASARAGRQAAPSTAEPA